MAVIKFSNLYEKLPCGINGKRARLVFVRLIALQKQMRAFLDYDTRILGSNEHYPLPVKGKYILLLFDYDGTVFTTLRRHTEEKFLYYSGLVGQDLQVEVG
jgi:hypothetical protein